MVFFLSSVKISISCFSEIYRCEASDLKQSSVFAFQTIDITGLKLNLFYDSGCWYLIVEGKTVDKLM